MCAEVLGELANVIAGLLPNGGIILTVGKVWSGGGKKKVRTGRKQISLLSSRRAGRKTQGVTDQSASGLALGTWWSS